MTDSEKRKKKLLVKYLGDYIEHEMEDNVEYNDWWEAIEQGIDAFESIEGMEIFVV